MPDPEFHPIAEIFPLMDDLSDLAGDIEANGLREAIWLHRDGRIVDGRNRYLACKQAGVEPAFRTYEGVKPLDCDFVAYAFEPMQTCYLFPFLGVRAAWEKHRCAWINKANAQEGGFRWVIAENQRYNTISIAVPIIALQACINDALTIHWQNATSNRETS